MALPAVTAQSPSSGSISWAAFTIQYQGVGYAVDAGSTAQRWVWWRYNGGVGTIIEAGANIPQDLQDDDLVLFGNKNGVPMRVQATSLIDGDLLVDGSVLADAIGANQITGVKILAGEIDTTHLKTNSVTAVQIAAGAVGADEILAGSVTAAKLTVGTVSASQVMNGSFSDGLDCWGILAGTNGGTIDILAVAGASGGSVARLNRNAGGTHLAIRQNAANYIPLSGAIGRKWHVSVRAAAAAAMASGLYLRVFWFQADKVTAATTAFTDVVANVAVTTAFQTFEGQVAPPANASWMAVSVYDALASTTMYVSDVAAREIIVSAMIGDGEVKATQISATAIDGKTITGALIQTSSGTGARVTQGVGGLIAYNSSNVAVTTISSSTGAITATSATISGAITATSGSITGAFQVTGTFYVGASPTANARVTVTSAGIIGYSAAGAATTTISATTGVLTATAAVITGQITASSGSITGNMQVSGTLYVGASATSGPRVTIVSSGIIGYNSAGTAITTISAATGVLTAQDVVLTGVITATSGVIGPGNMQVTGSLFVGASATTGARVRIFSSGIIAYDAASNPVTSIDGSTGAFTSSSAVITGQITATSGSITGPLDLGGTGLIRTAATGTRMELKTGGVQMFTTNAVEIDPVFMATGYGIDIASTVLKKATGELFSVGVEFTTTSSTFRLYRHTDYSLSTTTGTVLQTSTTRTFYELAIAGDGNLLVASYLTASYTDYKIQKFNASTGAEMTGSGFPIAMPTAVSYGEITVDASGNIYVVKPDSAGMLKYSSAGVAAPSPWVSTVNMAANGYYVDSIQVDATNVVTLHSFYIEKWLLTTGARVNTGGFPINLQTVIDPTFTGYAMDMDAAGNFYVIGVIAGANAIPKIYKISPAGALLTGSGWPVDVSRSATTLAIDSARNLAAYTSYQNRALVSKISMIGAQTTDISTTLGSARLSNLSVSGSVKLRVINAPYGGGNSLERIYVGASDIIAYASQVEDDYALTTKRYVDDRLDKVSIAYENAGILSGGTVGNAQSNVVVSTYAPNQTNPTPTIVGAKRIQVTCHGSAWAGGNQACTWNLYVSWDTGTTWTRIGIAQYHNGGWSQNALGPFLQAELDIPSTSSIAQTRVQLRIDVGGGGFGVSCGMFSWTTKAWKDDIYMS